MTMTTSTDPVDTTGRHVRPVAAPFALPTERGGPGEPAAPHHASCLDAWGRSVLSVLEGADGGYDEDGIESHILRGTD